MLYRRAIEENGKKKLFGGRWTERGIGGTEEDVKLTFFIIFNSWYNVAVERNSRWEKLIILRRWVRPIFKMAKGDGGRGNRIRPEVKGRMSKKGDGKNKKEKDEREETGNFD